MSSRYGRRYTEYPLGIVGSNKFGRHPWMSSEQTFNMIVIDNHLTPFAGYARADEVSNQGQGRGISSAQNIGSMFAVIDNDVYRYDTSLRRQYIGTLETYVGDVFIAENNAEQVAFCDKLNIYIYDNRVDKFYKLTPDTLGFLPGYISFQNGYFISVDQNTNQWRLSESNNGLSWPFEAQTVGDVSTKPGNAVAALPFPGKGNLLLVFGQSVAENWVDVGAKLFPYQRSQSSNIDFGCINPATIASNGKMVCWVSVNEKSGPRIVYSTGGDAKEISTDGINFKLAQLKKPEDCYGFMLMLDGRVVYITTWVTDNLTYMYDFDAQRFYTLTDENMDAFIVKRVAFFNNKYYFVSIRDGNLYQLSGDFGVYDYGNGNIKEIPYIRVTSSFTEPSQDYFIVGYAGFAVEQGNFRYTRPATDNIPRVDMSTSKDSAINFSSYDKIEINPEGDRIARMLWRNMGAANDITFQFRFHGLGRFLAHEGVVGVYS